MVIVVTMSAPPMLSVSDGTNGVDEIDAIVESVESNGVREPEIETAVSCSHPLMTDNERVRDSDGPDQSEQCDPELDSNNANKNKKDRRVVFPKDNNVVLGYMHPKPPWMEASKCSTDELLTAYRFSCDQHGVRPLTKLMQQLVSIEDFKVRNETLVLRGEVLDSRHVETLEEVFRRVQYKTIDVEATRLDEEGAVALFEMVEYYESCFKLNISFNKNIGNRGWQACSRMIKKTPGLEHLEARGCTFPEQMMPCFGRALRMGSILTSLHLENASLSGRSLLILVAAIKMNEVLRELYLADNKLMPSDGTQLGNMLKYNHNLQLLDVRNNHLQDVGTSHICDGLWEQNLDHGLNTLVLWNNQVTYQSMPAVARALINTKCLETLNLGHNNLTTEGIHRLKEGLLQNKSLKRIGLQAARITCEGAVALAEFIAESPRLMRLDLRENDIKTAGLMALSLSLKVSESVTRIDLDKDPKRENSMRDYAEQQRRLLNDISNYMLRNRDLLRQRELAEEEKMRQEAQRLTQEALQAEEEKKQAKLASLAAEADAKSQDANCNHLDKAEGDGITEASVGSQEETPKGSPSRNLKLDLNVSLPAGQTLASQTSDSQTSASQTSVGQTSASQTLESPMFVPESQMPVCKPTDINLPIIQEDGESLLALGNQQLPKEFPPSPMVSAQGHPFLAAVRQENSGFVISPDDAPDPFPNSSTSVGVSGIQTGLLAPPTKPKTVPLSPNSRRKFQVSRVIENPVVERKSVASNKSDLARLGNNRPDPGSGIILPDESSDLTCMTDGEAVATGQLGEALNCKAAEGIEASPRKMATGSETSATSQTITQDDSPDKKDSLIESPCFEGTSVDTAGDAVGSPSTCEIPEGASTDITSDPDHQASSCLPQDQPELLPTTIPDVHCEKSEPSVGEDVDFRDQEGFTVGSQGISQDMGADGSLSADNSWLHIDGKIDEGGLLNTNLSINGMREELANALDDLVIKPTKDIQKNESKDDFEQEIDDYLANIAGDTTSIS